MTNLIKKQKANTLLECPAHTERVDTTIVIIENDTNFISVSSIRTE